MSEASENIHFGEAWHHGKVQTLWLWRLPCCEQAQASDTERSPASVAVPAQCLTFQGRSLQPAAHTIIALTKVTRCAWAPMEPWENWCSYKR
jgi:hypothetical protein